MFLTESFWQPIELSLKIASMSLILVTVLGIVAAWFMSRKEFWGKTIVETVFLLPMVLPPTVVGFILIVVFGANGTIGQLIERFFHHSIMFTPWAALVASVVVSFPLMYESVKSGINHVDREIEEAAKMDGASSWKVFLFITLPLSYRSILAGMILSFARGLGEFGATLMFAGNIPSKTQTLPTAIYVAIETGNMTLAWAWVSSLIVLSFMMLLVVRRFK